MSTKSSTDVFDVVPMMMWITEHKLNAKNYLYWRQTIEQYSLSVSMYLYV